MQLIISHMDTEFDDILCINLVGVDLETQIWHEMDI